MENSDVPDVVVAVAVIAYPTGIMKSSVVIVAMAPFASDTSVCCPTKVAPSPFPLESHEELMKRSVSTAVAAVVATCQLICVVVALLAARSTVGKFCRSFGPVSASLGLPAAP